MSLSGIDWQHRAVKFDQRDLILSLIVVILFGFLNISRVANTILNYEVVILSRIIDEYA